MSDASAVQKAASGPDPLIGRLINDRFKIVSQIARGGMGKVYRAEQAPLGRICALKVLNPNYAGDSDPEFHKRFFLEASIASKLTHPNTVTIFDYGQTDDEVYFIAMEYLEGRTLHRAIRGEAPFDEERAAHIARQICRALREAHSLGVIHRDLKPANIYLVEHADESDFVKVLDFGLVKSVEGNTEDLTQAGLFMGSPKYMSPEQIRGDKVDVRTDIYSLGVVLYEMVTGKVPFDRPNSVNILMAHVNEAPPPLRQMTPDVAISPALEEVIFKCLAKDPNERFASMDELLVALKRTGAGALTGTMSGLGTGEFLAAQNLSASQSGSGPQLGNYAAGSGSQSGPLPQLSSAVAEPSTGKRSSTGMVVGIAAIVAVMAGVGFMATNQSGASSLSETQSTSQPTATQTATATPSAQPAETASAAPVEKKATIRIESEPAGASVRLKDKEGEEICKETPCDYSLTGEDAEHGKELKLYIAKPGFIADSKPFKVGDEKLSVRLSPIPVARPAGGGNKPAQNVDNGFKPVPYLSTRLCPPASPAGERAAIDWIKRGALAIARQPMRKTVCARAPFLRRRRSS